MITTIWSKLNDQFIEPIIGIFYPNLCPGCASETIPLKQPMCLQCLRSLPFTGFEKIQHNPVEKIFWGRVEVSFAFSIFYYIDNTPIQNIIHEIKYKGDKRTALALGRWIGEKIKDKVSAFHTDLIIPMPLHPKKEKQRGYNQATLLCTGMKQTTGIDHNEKILIRNQFTTSQTTKSRMKRWENVGAVFSVPNPDLIRGKNLILVDDVITTGASTEACVGTLMNAGAGSVGVCSLAFTP